jgi:hypothetical protein
VSALCPQRDGAMTCIAMAGHEDECVFDKAAPWRSVPDPVAIRSLQFTLPNGAIARIEDPEFIRHLSASPVRPAPWEAYS